MTRNLQSTSLPLVEKFFLLGALWASGTTLNGDYSVGVIIMIASFLIMWLGNKLVFKPAIIIGVGILTLLWVIQLFIYSPDADVVLVFKYIFLILMCLVFTTSHIENNNKRLVYFIKLVLFFSVLSGVLFFLYIL